MIMGEKEFGLVNDGLWKLVTIFSQSNAIIKYDLEDASTL